MSHANMSAGYFRGVPLTWAYDKSLITFGNVKPSATGFSLGTSSACWANIYLQNAPTIISEESAKDEIAALSEAEIATAKQIAPLIVLYKMKSAMAEKGSTAARKHCGWIAQRVEAAFAAHGLDAFAYGCVGADPAMTVVTKMRVVHDGDGTAREEPYQSEEPDCDARGAPRLVHNIRPDEVTAFALAGLAARIAALEEAART